MSKKSESAKKKTVTVKWHLGSTTIRRILLIVWNAIAAVSVLVTIWVAVTPRVFVHPTIPLDPSNPLFTPFVVRNEGYLAIRDVKFSCSMKYLKFASGGPLAIGIGDYTNRFSDPKQVARVIAAGEEYSELLPLSGLEHNQIENADIAIVLSFRPIRWLPWRRERLHRFVVTQSKDGQRYWLPQPINK